MNILCNAFVMRHSYNMAIIYFLSGKTNILNKEENMKKRIVAIVLAAGMVTGLVSMAGCTSQSSDSAGSVGNLSAEEESSDTAAYGMEKAPAAEVDESKQYRVIMDGDIACEVDDIYACAYALMSPKLDVVGLCAEQWGTQWSDTSMEDGYVELQKLTEAMGITDVPIARGAVNAIADDGTYEMNDASQLIIDEALKDDDRPLIVIATGTMTNIAIAYLECPEIADKLIVVGNSLPTGGWDFNLGNDYNACNILMDSPIDWYLDGSESDTTYKATLTTLYQKIAHCGEAGEYLWDRTLYANEQLSIRIGQDVEMGFLGQGLNEVELRGFVPNGEVFELNDVETVARVLSMGYAEYEMVDARHLTAMVGGLDTSYVPVRQLKQFTNSTDVNCFMEDFYDKFEYYYGE